MISDVYFPRVNGVSTSIQTFRKELIQLGHRVVLIAPRYGNEKNDDADIVRIASRPVFGDPEDRMMQRRPLYRYLRTLKPDQFDLVHIQTPFVAHYAGTRIAARLRRPCIESYHTLFEEYLYHYIPFLPCKFLRYIARRFTRRQCRAVNTVIAPSQPMQQVLIDYGVSTPIEIIPTGMQMEQFSKANGDAFRRKHGIPADRPVLVHVGRIAHEKNIDFLIKVLALVRQHIRSVLLIVAGEGPALNHIQALARKLRLEENTLFVGYLSRDHELMDCYQAGDVFVFASLTETQGLVLLEAMALGVPVVSIAHLGTEDILRCQRGALIADNDINDFSSKVIRLLEDSAMQKQLGEDGRRYSAEWSATRQAEKLYQLYQGLL